MKLFTAAFFATFLLALRAAVAQDANMVPIPDNPSSPSAQPTPSPLFPNEAPPPIQNRQHSSGGHSNDNARTLPGSGPAPAKKKLTTGESEQDIADRIKFREAKTKALRDEKVQDALARADAAKTEQEKRAALKDYYTLLYAKILKFDGSIKKLVAARLQESLKQLDQSRVRPEDYPQQASAKH